MRVRTLALMLALELIGAGSSARADGIPAYQDTTGWHLLGEQVQQAVITLRDNRETMLLGVEVAPDATPEQASKLAWLTPVPASPDAVRVDILRGFPSISGVEPRAALASYLRGALAVASLTQIYTIVPTMGLVMLRGGSRAGEEPARVVQRVRRHGVELELLAAPSRSALVQHLAAKGVELPGAALDALSSYVGRSCLVLFRIVDLPAYRRAAGGGGPGLGVEVSFPTTEGFFPLVASSALPGARLEVLVTVLDHVRPVGDAPPGLLTRHYVGGVGGETGVLRVLGLDPGGRQRLRYTRMTLVGPPAALTRDLRFRPGAARGTALASAILVSPHLGWGLLVLMALVLVVVSLVAVRLTRPIWPAGHRPSRRTLLLLGLANLLTLLAVLVAAMIVSRRVGAPPRRAALFTLAQSGVICLLLAGLALLTYAI